jgi:transcriptional regulator with XRE-family HTH domain
MTPNRRLKQVRELRGWSQAKVAEQIGTDATTVSRWERGLFSPTPYFRERLCMLFDKNAEELGLLEAEIRSPERVQQHVISARPSMGVSTSLKEKQDWQRTEVHTGTLLPPETPSWPLRGDTFAYILHSAAYDQQAYTLWEDAYVRAMRGQRIEAQQLGEASLNAFEHVGHPNAEALREWLKKNELDPPPGPPINIPSAPLPLLPKPPRRTILQFFRRRSASIALISLVIAVLCLAGFAFNQLYLSVPGVQALVQVTPVAKATIPAQLALKSATTATTSTVVVTPKAVSTTRPAVPTPTPIVDAPTLTITVTPASLTPANCVVDSGYRCTLNIMLFSTGNNSLTWEVRSTNLPALFSPDGGSGTSGSSYQVIAYIHSAPGQSSQLIFTLTSSSYSRTFSVPWQD